MNVGGERQKNREIRNNFHEVKGRPRKVDFSSKEGNMGKPSKGFGPIKEGSHICGFLG